jgi:hypothetical protein
MRNSLLDPCEIPTASVTRTLVRVVRVARWCAVSGQVDHDFPVVGRSACRVSCGGAGFMVPVGGSPSCGRATPPRRLPTPPSSSLLKATASSSSSAPRNNHAGRMPVSRTSVELSREVSVAGCPVGDPAEGNGFRRSAAFVRQHTRAAFHARSPRSRAQRVDLTTCVRWNCQRSTMRNPTRLGVKYAGARRSTRPGGSDFPLWWSGSVVS